jgi:hypothetical protein
LIDTDSPDNDEPLARFPLFRRRSRSDLGEILRYRKMQVVHWKDDFTTNSTHMRAHTELLN